LEALTNVAKYAEATHAAVTLAQVNGRLEFEVIDDGKGFDTETNAYGTGLLGMRDRLDAIGGKLTITSAPGAGATITGTILTGSAA
jgi:signal transduction histidine kinase